jgi:hypothetical protein
MNSDHKNFRSYKNLEIAKKRFPKGKGPQRLLVLNNQGLPIMQVSAVDDFNFMIDEHECAEVADLARNVYNGIKAFRGREPDRVAFFFNDEIITVERDGPFILLINWSEAAFKSNSGSETFIKRLESTLFEELS